VTTLEQEEDRQTDRHVTQFTAPTHSITHVVTTDTIYVISQQIFTANHLTYKQYSSGRYTN